MINREGLTEAEVRVADRFQGVLNELNHPEIIKMGIMHYDPNCTCRSANSESVERYVFATETGREIEILVRNPNEETSE